MPNDPVIAGADPSNCLYISDAADKASQYWLSPYLVMGTLLTLTQVAVGASAVYSFSALTGPAPAVGQQITVAGFANAGNNVTAVLTAVDLGAQTVTVALTTQVNETHAATASTPAQDPGLIVPGASNATLIRCGWNNGCKIPGGGELGPSAKFDLFITNAGFSLNLFPDPSGTHGLTTLVSEQPAVNSQGGFFGPGDVFVNPFGPWDPATATPAIAHGHECLMARIYPDTLVEGNFPKYPAPGANIQPYIATDLHYAQHNCWVGPSEGKFFRIQIGDGNPLEEQQLVAIQAVPDINPSQKVLAAALGGLQQIPGFKQISNTLAPGPIKLDVSGLPRPHESFLDKIEDFIENAVHDLIRDLESKCEKAGGAHARAEIAPKSFGKFLFSVDFTGATPGDAYIYHVSQVNGKGQPYGGATVAVVVT